MIDTKVAFLEKLVINPSRILNKAVDLVHATESEKANDCVLRKQRYHLFDKKMEVWRRYRPYGLQNNVSKRT